MELVNFKQNKTEVVYSETQEKQPSFTKSFLKNSKPWFLFGAFLALPFFLKSDKIQHDFPALWKQWTSGVETKTKFQKVIERSIDKYYFQQSSNQSKSDLIHESLEYYEKFSKKFSLLTAAFPIKAFDQYLRSLGVAFYEGGQFEDLWNTKVIPSYLPKKQGAEAETVNDHDIFMSFLGNVDEEPGELEILAFTIISVHETGHVLYKAKSNSRLEEAYTQMGAYLFGLRNLRETIPDERRVRQKLEQCNEKYPIFAYRLNVLCTLMFETLARDPHEGLRLFYGNHVSELLKPYRKLTEETKSRAFEEFADTTFLRSTGLPPKDALGFLSVLVRKYGKTRFLKAFKSLKEQYAFNLYLSETEKNWGFHPKATDRLVYQDETLLTRVGIPWKKEGYYHLVSPRGVFFKFLYSSDSGDASRTCEDFLVAIKKEVESKPDYVEGVTVKLHPTLLITNGVNGEIRQEIIDFVMAN